MIDCVIEFLSNDWWMGLEAVISTIALFILLRDYLKRTEELEIINLRHLMNAFMIASPNKQIIDEFFFRIYISIYRKVLKCKNDDIKMEFLFIRSGSNDINYLSHWLDYTQDIGLAEKTKSQNRLYDYSHETYLSTMKSMNKMIKEFSNKNEIKELHSSFCKIYQIEDKLKSPPSH